MGAIIRINGGKVSRTIGEGRGVMKQLINLLGVIFLIVSLVVIVVAAVMSFTGKAQSGQLILQLIIGICSAVIGVAHIVIAAILSKRA